MARRYGKQNGYRSRIRRCALSGLRGYEHRMVQKNGLWYLPRWVDRGVHGREGRVVAGAGAGRAGTEMLDPWTHGRRNTPSSTPSPSATASATPSATISMTVSSTGSATPSATPSASPSGSWVEKTSNTYWGGTNATWDGDSWEESGPGITLTEAGTWNEAYRPTKIRVTGIMAEANGATLTDTNNAIIASWTPASAAVEADITFGSYNLNKIGVNRYSSITKIEFYEE